MIQLTDIRKTYLTGETETTVLHGVSVSIAQGEMVAIMGKSGSGKSTLLHIIGTLDRATSGTYAFNGHDLTEATNKDLALFRNQSIGFVFQSYFLMGHKNALDNVTVPLLYNKDPVPDASEKGKNILEKVGMGDRLHHKPSELSGGQCQRVAIARALVNAPSIILADEPTGALDTNTSNDIITLFQQLNKEGQTIIMVTHDEQIGEACQRCIRIVDGRIVKE